MNGLLVSMVLAISTVAYARISLNPNLNNDVRNYYENLAQRNITFSGACDDCKLVASELKNVIDNPAKLARIKIALHFLCEYIGGERAQECKNVVDNLDVIIHQLQPYLDDPEQFCREIHLCAHGNVKMSTKVFVHILKFMIRASKREDVGNMLCDECVFGATELNSLLQSPQVQQDMRKSLEDICNMLPTFKQKCNDAIELYFPKVLEFFQKLVSDPQKFCAELHVCQTVQFKSLRDFNSAPKKLRRLEKISRAAQILQTRSGNNVLCVTCMAGIESMKEKLAKKEDVYANRIGEAVCGALPQEFQVGCLDFSRIYAVALLNMTIEQFKPEEVCRDFGLCTSLEIENFNSLESKAKSDTVCEACRTFADFLSYEFRQPNLQHEMTDYVKEYVCRKLPGDLANQCLDTADQYVPNIMQRLADTLTSASFCIEVGMCNN